eukprot:gene29762-36857_t
MTPPNFKQKVGANSHTKDSDSKLPKPLDLNKGVLNSSSIATPGSGQKAGGGHHHAVSSSSALHSSATSSTAHHHHSRSVNDAAKAMSPQAHPKRSSVRPHIQLEVLSGEKLMPAKKGAARDHSGDPIADRIPCLKVTLSLPVWSNGVVQPPGEREMKKISHLIRDFETTTLNPHWNASFTLSLPCTKQMVCSLLPPGRDVLLSAMSKSGNDVGGEEDELEEIMGSLTDKEHHHLLTCLLQWYASGTILIEVVDGERFNEEIFIGQTTVLLSSLNLQINRHNYAALDIHGAFQLEKHKPSDRVSGSVKLCLFLHPPERQFLEECERGGGVKLVTPEVSHQRGVKSASNTGADNAGGVAGSSASAQRTTTAASQHASRRIHIQDITKQLDGLNSSVLASTESAVNKIQSTMHTQGG